MVQSEANTGYALLSESGNVLVADETFRGWLGERTLAELLPEFVLNGDLAVRQRTKFCPLESASTLVEIECRQLSGQSIVQLLLRVEIPDHEIDQGYRDAVTGLPDRRALVVHRANLLCKAQGRLPHAVLFLDLDNFKQVNDSLGHAVGDHVLAILADRWRKSLRGRDLIVRYGGDEFVVLLAGVRSHADVRPIIERLRATTIAPIGIDNHQLRISVAVGVALAEDAARPIDDLLDAADKAMYAAKRQGN